jgi:hypothetical protein
MDVKRVSSIIMTRLLSNYSFNASFLDIYIWSIIQIGSTVYPPRSVAIICSNWLNGADHSFMLLIKAGAIAVLWSLWLFRNDKNFNNK